MWLRKILSNFFETEIKSLKTRTSEIEQILNSMPQEDLKLYQDHVPIVIGRHKINPDELIFEEKICNSESFMPEVVEPSLGLDRIMAVVLEHNFCQREADGRKFFTFPANVAPYKVRGDLIPESLYSIYSITYTASKFEVKIRKNNDRQKIFDDFSKPFYETL